MEALENGKHKLSEICDLIKKDTIEPAQREAASIIDAAHKEAERIISKAKVDAESIKQEADQKIHQEKVLFENSMDVASKQTFSKLRQEIENTLFSKELSSLVTQIAHDEKKVAQLVNVIVEVIEREGLNGDITLGLSKTIRAEELSKYLAKDLLAKLEKNEVPIETISGGAIVKIKDKNLSVDVSDQALKELMGSYLRSSFREVLFKNV